MLSFIGTDKDRSAICDLLLVMDLSRDDQRFGRNSHTFPPEHLAPTLNARGGNWHFITAVMLQKTRVMPLPEGPKSLTIDKCIRLHTPQRDGQTDGRT